MSYCEANMYQISISAGAPLGELTALSRPLAGFKGSYF